MGAALWVLLAKIRSTVYRERERRDFEEELAAHLALAADENIRRGLAAPEASRQARLALGHPGTLLEEIHERRGLPLLETLAQDAAYGWRALRRSPALAAGSLLALGLAIGVPVALFRLTAILREPLPFPEAGRLAIVARSGPLLNIPAPLFRAWRENLSSFSGMALFDRQPRPYAVGEPRDAQLVLGLRVSPELFSVLGVAPMLGRTFDASDGPAVVLGYELWRSRFRADPGIAGRQIPIDGRPHTVLGVMPRAFRFESPAAPATLWLPIGPGAAESEHSPELFGVCARLADNVSWDAARRRTDRAARAVAAHRGNRSETATLTPLADVGAARWLVPLRAGLVLSMLALLAAALTVANLILARTGGRRRELSLHRALGASESRLFRRLWAEGALLAAGGTLCGLAAGALLLTAARPALLALGHVPFRRFEGAGIDAAACGFGALLGVLAAAIFALAAAARRSTTGPLRQDPPRNAGRGRNLLLALQIGLSLPIVAAAGFMIASMGRLLLAHPGLEARGVATFRTPELSQPAAFCGQIRSLARALDTVEAASATNHLPLSSLGVWKLFRAEDLAGPAAPAQFSVTCPAYFQTLGIPLVAGRDFTDRDGPGSKPVAIVSQSFARRFGATSAAIGRRIRGGEPADPWLTIVGVAGDVRVPTLTAAPPRQVYRPFDQCGWRTMSVILKSRGAPPHQIGPAAQRALQDELGGAAPSITGSMEEVVSRGIGPQRSLALLLGVLGSFALALTAASVHGVAAHAARERTQEIGIRIALGARPADVVRLVAGRCLGWCALGAGLGIAATLPLAALFTGVLDGVRPLDPAVLASAAALVFGVASLASLAAARRGARIDPLAAIRFE